MTERERDDVTGTETTGHEWDGIKELNTPLPRWWLWTFYGTIVFALVYSILYPSWPLITSATSGVLGYSSRAELDKELEAAKTAQGALLTRVATTPVTEILSDPDLTRFARAGGQSLFKVHCSQCHGTGAAGAKGYPNLNDDEWIWGGTVEQIATTISYGARSPGVDETHFNMMPAFGKDGVLTPEELAAVAGQVASLSGIEGGQSTPEGQQIFTDNCVACHGEGGMGNVDVGGPSLNDKVWLYDGSLAGIEAQLANPKHGVMPAWGARLGDTAVKELAIYVHGLGGGL